MHAITAQIEAALEARLHFLAIFVAVAIPDICAAMESQDGITNRTKYKAWYRQWLGDAFPFLSDGQMYSLRCGIVHEGRAVHEGLAARAVSTTGTASIGSLQSYTRVLFTIPTDPVTVVAEGAAIHFTSSGESVYLQDAELFCRGVITAANQWSAEKTDNQTVQRHMVDLFRFRPEGYRDWNYPLIG
jgi:hypothetical protein